MCDVLVQPFLGADVGYVYARAFSESRADSLNLHEKGRSVWSPNLYLGAHFSTSAGCVQLNADLAYQHRFGSLGTTLHSRFIDFGETFSIKGRNYSRNGLIGCLNAVMDLSGCAEFYVEFSGEYWGHRGSYAGTIGLRRSW